MRPLVLADFAGTILGRQVGQAVGGYRGWVHEDDRTSVRLGLALRELEEVQRALDVHLVRRHRRELGARREERGEVKHELDLKLREYPLEDAAIEDRSGDLAIDLGRDRWIETRDVERDDGAIGLARQAIDQAMTDLAAGAGNEHNGFAHGEIIVE